MNRWRSARRGLRGFTLVELLVVITIIGILIALLLPAVQAARESARKVQCQNNVKQLSLGMLSFESSNGAFPTGGWGYSALGDPDRGFGQFKQPGGWIFQILPYMEQQNIFSMSAGLTGSARANALGQMCQTMIAVHNCPSRRQQALVPYVASTGPFPQVNWPSQLKAVSDYACNAGDYGDDWAMGSFPDSQQSSYATADKASLATWIGWCSEGLNEGEPPFIQNPFQAFNGPSFTLSHVTLAAITDGASNTYLLGEKYLNPDEYFTGTSWADDQPMYVGFDNDNYRTNYYSPTNPGGNPWFQPTQDTPGFPDTTGFGSAHPGSCVFSFCDGSIHTISYSIDGETNRRLANSKDGLPIDPTKF